MRILVTDIGYGDTKYVVIDGEEERRGKMPTLIAPVVDTGGFGESAALSFGGREYLVGGDARFAGYVVPTTTEDFLVSYSPLILGRILMAEDLDGVDAVVVSLSLRDWDKRVRLEKAVRSFTVSGRTFSHEVYVKPQGFGIWVDQGRPENAVIVDIGFNTVDVLMVVDGVAKREFSFAVAGLGTTAFISDVTEIVNRKAVQDFTPNEMAHLLQNDTGLLKKFGVVDEVAARKITWSKDLWSRLMSRPVFKKGLELLDVVIVAGGGARFFEGIRDSRIRVVKDEPEFSNVRGFVRLIKAELGGGN